MLNGSWSCRVLLLACSGRSVTRIGTGSSPLPPSSPTARSCCCPPLPMVRPPGRARRQATGFDRRGQGLVFLGGCPRFRGSTDGVMVVAPLGATVCLPVCHCTLECTGKSRTSRHSPRRVRRQSSTSSHVRAESKTLEAVGTLQYPSWRTLLASARGGPPRRARQSRPRTYAQRPKKLEEATSRRCR